MLAKSWIHPWFFQKKVLNLYRGSLVFVWIQLFSSQVGGSSQDRSKKSRYCKPILRRGMNQIYDPENQEITDIHHLRPENQKTIDFA
jgi:hypothetical protein